METTHTRTSDTAPDIAEVVESTPAEARTAVLRTMSYDEARTALAPTGAQATFFSDLFKRLDRSRDGALNKKEIVAQLKAVGIGGGLFGIIHSKVANKFIEQLDTSGDEKVTLAEFKAIANQILPPTLFDEQGHVQPELVDETFQTLDANKDGRITVAELEAGLLAQLPEDTDHKTIIAEVGAKMGVDALDLDRDGGIQRGEMDTAAGAVAALRTG